MLDLKKTDLSAIAEKGYRFQLVLPEVETPLDAWVTVRGEESTKVIDFGKKKITELQNKQKLHKRKYGKDLDDMSVAEMEDFGVENASIRVISWEGIAEGKTEVPCTEENIQRILREHRWIRNQVMDQSSKLSNFLE